MFSICFRCWLAAIELLLLLLQLSDSEESVLVLLLLCPRAATKALNGLDGTYRNYGIY